MTLFRNVVIIKNFSGGKKFKVDTFCAQNFSYVAYSSNKLGGESKYARPLPKLVVKKKTPKIEQKFVFVAAIGLV